jgi:hypothetical protein
LNELERAYLVGIFSVSSFSLGRTTFGKGRRFMPNLQNLGLGGIIFLVGAIIYIINLLLGLARRGKVLPFDGVGLMVLGIGIALLLKS